MLLSVVAKCDVPRVTAAPLSWVPLLRYLGVVQIDQVTTDFPEEEGFSYMALDWLTRPLTRQFVEWACALRPELVEALFLADTAWRVRGVLGPLPPPDAVTTFNGLFHPALTEFARTCLWLRPPVAYDGAVLIPNPIERPEHARLVALAQQYIPDYYQILTVSSVYGIVPLECLHRMPRTYVAFIHEWRVYQGALSYFKPRGFMKKVLVFEDVLSVPVERALQSLHLKAWWARTPAYYKETQDFTSPALWEAASEEASKP